ncbi:MAG: hypothetical protein JXA74_17575, partial [Anaerolineae bacterium]|nr:hypothetical protein [Anaerolineae bacterium]
MDPISERDLRTFCDNTILVLTRAPERASDWRAQLEEALAMAQEAGAVEHAAFFQALLTLLEGREPQLPPDHPAAQGPYAADIARVQRAVQALSRQGTATETLPAAAETLPAEQLDVIVRNTLGVLTVAKA